MVQKGSIKIHNASTGEQVVYVLNKPLSRVNFEYFHEKLGVVLEDFPRKDE